MKLAEKNKLVTILLNIKEWAIAQGDINLEDLIKRLDQEVEMQSNYRSLQQNASIHLYLTHLAKALNEQGHTLQDVIKAIKRAQIKATMEALKETLWKPMQWAMFKKKSTTQLKTNEVDQVYEMINAFISREFPNVGHIPFPSQETKNENKRN